MTTTPIGLPLIETFLDRGDAADLPDAATLNANTNSGSCAIFYAEDTTTVYVLNRTTVAWDAVVIGGSGITQLTGDVTAGPGSGSQATTIANSTVTNAKMANMPTLTVKANLTGSAAAPQDATITALASILSPFLSGGGGVGGPLSSVIGNIPVFADEYGIEIEDSGIAATDIPLAISGEREPFDRGTISSGTETPEPSDGAVQIAENGGAHTLAPPTETGWYVLTYINGSGAGAITAGAWDRVDDPDTALSHTVENSIIECAAYNDGIASRLIVSLIVDAT